MRVKIWSRNMGVKMWAENCVRENVNLNVIWKFSFFEENQQIFLKIQKSKNPKIQKALKTYFIVNRRKKAPQFLQLS
jgi:hypothetical protein